MIFKGPFEPKWFYDSMFYKIIYLNVNLGQGELVYGSIGGVYVTRALKLVKSIKEPFKRSCVIVCELIS